MTKEQTPFQTNKVHIKIKTTAFEVYTRTKSLSDYTADPRTIYEAAKYLLVTEYNKSEGKLRLRLIGVRVSSLKDSDTIEAGKNSKQTNKTKANEPVEVNKPKGSIESFFRRKSDEMADQPEEILEEDSDSELFSLQSIFSQCPHCGIFIEGNKEFFFQHLDSCLRYSTFVCIFHSLIIKGSGYVHNSSQLFAQL